MTLLTKILAGLALTFSCASAVGQTQSHEQDVQNYVRYLNKSFPDLKLVPMTYEFQTFQELGALDNSLKGQTYVAPGNLEKLSCTKPECGGSGSGPCPTCYH